MSHEISTPLNAVIGLSHLAMNTDLSDKQLDYFMKIHSASESLWGIINDILDFSKIEAGKLTLVEESFDLEDIFHKLGNVITYKANTKGLEIAFGIDTKVPTYLIGDATRLEQVLVNLCSNAIKFTDQGEVVVCVSLISEADQAIKLQFDVTDTGIGMDEVQLSKLFQPFTQANDTISRKYGGTGLGLSIIKRLVDMMHGQVWAESELGEGSKFHFTAEFKKQKLQVKVPVPRADLRNKTVLVVDDSSSARAIIKHVLDSFSMEVVTASSGIEAIHYLKNNYLRPVDFVLMDCRMPGMDGIQAARIIRHDSQLASLHIVMMSTGYASDELFREAEELGLQGIAIKPIRNSKLYDLLMAIVSSGSGTMTKESQSNATSPVLEMQSGNVLLVEDNDINQQVAKEVLEGFGFKVEIAGNGQDAVERVRQSGVPSRFDVVLMDLQMPVMGGRAATTEIRRMKEYDSLPVIALSADAMTSVRDECLDIGMNDFLTKPINPYTMLETIRKWIRPRAALSQLDETSQPLGRAAGTTDCIDINDGLSHVGGKHKFYYDLLAQFLMNNQNYPEELVRSLRDDPQKARRMIHTMKGLSGNLGMRNLYELSKKLEKAIQNNEDQSSVLLSVKEEFEHIVRTIQTIIKGNGIYVPASDPDRVIPSLLQLEKLLLANDPDAALFIAKLGSIGGYEVQIEELRKAVVNYDFDRAMDLLIKLRTQFEGRLEPSS
jgi:CheY-like chemotaxis protein/HPt (histidine-containing phosphotransfer) domain-containing protein/anti-sigma regulatory factor (Ser/Thr protein kinase)